MNTLPQPYRPAPPPRRTAVMIIAPTRAAALAKLSALYRQRRVAEAMPLRLITAGPDAGRYAIPVALLPAAPDPRWARLCKAIGAVLAGVAVLVLAVRWLLVSLSATALAVLCATVLLAFVAAVWAWFRRPTVSVSAISSVRIR